MGLVCIFVKDYSCAKHVGWRFHLTDGASTGWMNLNKLR